MALATATITGKFFLPDGVTPRNLHVSVSAETVNGTVKSAAENSVLSGVYEATSDLTGLLTISLPLLAGLQPDGARWRATFSEFAGVPNETQTPPSVVFDLTGNTTWAALVDVSGVPVTDSLVAQFQALRDDTVAAAATVAALPTTTDGLIAGRITTKGSATEIALTASTTTAITSALVGRPINLWDSGVSPANSAATNTTNLTAAVTAAPAGSRLILPGASTPVAINNGILINKRLTLAGLNGAAAIQQTVWGKPVFDVLNAADVTIEQFAFTNAAPRDATIGGSVRDGGGKTYAAAIWAAADRLTVRGVSGDGFTSVVRLTNWDNVAGVGSGYSSDCTIDDLLATNCDWGFVGTGLERLHLDNIRGSYSLSPGSGDPTHLIYVADSQPNRDVSAGTCMSYDSSGGHAYQFKSVSGLTFEMLAARNVPGILSLRDVQTVRGALRSLNDLGDSNGSLYIQGAGTETDIRLAASFVMAASAGNTRVARIDGTDGEYEISADYANTAQSDEYMVRVSGSRNHIIRPRLRNTGAAGAYRGVGLVSGSGHTVTGPAIRDSRVGVTVVAGVTDCGVDYDPKRSTRHAVSGSALVSLLEPTAQARPARSRLEYVVGTANVGTTIRPDETTHAFLSVNGTSNFSISTPAGAFKGANVSIEIFDNSGSAMGTVAWNSTWDLAVPWTNPAPGKSRTIAFAFDGTKMREVSRTA